MSRILTILTLLVLACSSVAAQARVVSLETLLSRLHENPEAKALQADASLASAQAEIARNRQGWSVFGGADIGHFRELDATAGKVDYTGEGLRLGLRHPLLGALRQQVEATKARQTEANRARAAAALAQGEHRLALRLAYANWWRDQRVQELCESQKVLADRETNRINKRHDNGQLRRSDHLWLTRSWRQVMRGCQNTATALAESRQRLQQLTQYPIPDDGIAVAPAIKAELPPPEHWHAALDSHPLLEQRHQEWQVTRKKEDKWYDAIDASVSLSHQLDQRDDISGTGSGWVAGIDFEVPLAGIGRHPQTASIEKDAARYRWLDTRNRLQNELSQSLREYQNRFRELRSASEQVELAELRLWEQEQREQVANEGSFTASRSLMLDLARARNTQIEARHTAWQSLSELLLIKDLTEMPANASGAQAADTPWSKAIYVWQSHDLLSPKTREATLQAIKNAGFNTVYLGLTAKQLQNPELEQLLEETISHASTVGISTDLLLGEPLWLEDSHREDLVEILKNLSGVPFRNLHLDLEVEQLSWPVPAKTLEDWLKTLKTASEHSPWPVSIVAHHRWFTSAEFQSPVCIPCEMPKLGIQHISLMIYTTNLNSLQTMAAEATGQWPGLDFHIVQSVESQLPPENSWHGLSEQAISQLTRQWREQWQNLGVQGLAWQAWEYYPAEISGHRE